MAFRDPFLLGTLGALLEIPSPVAGGFDAPYTRTAAEHRSATGATTVDVLGAHREWALEFAYRHRGQADRLITRWTSPTTVDELRLVDPITPNRLSLDAASGGGVSGTADAVTPDDVTRVQPDRMPDELAGLLDGAYRWDHDGTGALLLDAADRVPIVEGEGVVFRVWARGTASVRPFVRYYLDDGAQVDNNTAPDDELDPDTWTEITSTGNADAGEISAAPGVKPTGGPGWVELTGAVFTTDPDDDGEWSPGGGAPVVVLVEFDHAYQAHGRREMTLTVREA